MGMACSEPLCGTETTMRVGCVLHDPHLALVRLILEQHVL